MGDLDLLGEVAGGGTYEQLLPHTRRVCVGGVELHVVSLPQLIRLKRAAGRPKDLEAIAELEILLEERRRETQDVKE
jgi:predicted nucleotidyltransferase